MYETGVIIVNSRAIALAGPAVRTQGASHCASAARAARRGRDHPTARRLPKACGHARSARTCGKKHQPALAARAGCGRRQTCNQHARRRRLAVSDVCARDSRAAAALERGRLQRTQRDGGACKGLRRVSCVLPVAPAAPRALRRECRRCWPSGMRRMPVRLPPPCLLCSRRTGFALQARVGDRSGERAVQFMVDMACQSCVAAVNKSLEGVEGTHARCCGLAALAEARSQQAYRASKPSWPHKACSSLAPPARNACWRRSAPADARRGSSAKARLQACVVPLSAVLETTLKPRFRVQGLTMRSRGRSGWTCARCASRSLQWPSSRARLGTTATSWESFVLFR